MKVFTLLVAGMVVMVLPACQESSLPTSGEAVTAARMPFRGEVIARNLCANCHGADFQGAPMGSIRTPSLSKVQSYSIGEFKRLLSLGVARDERAVNSAMKATRWLSEENQEGVYEFLVRTRP